MLLFRLLGLLCANCLLTTSTLAASPPTPDTSTYKRLKAFLDAVAAIDTHDHLWPFDKLPGYVETEHGRGMNLAGLWHSSYYRWTHPLTPWKPGGSFDDWWAKAKHDFADARATSFYRYQLPAFQDLYGIDFDRITDDQARQLNERIYRNYLNKNWLYEVVTQRANIELMFNDPYWARLDFRTDYPFGVLVFNVTTLTRGFHPSEFPNPLDDPYRFARDKTVEVKSLDAYLDLLDRLFREARDKGGGMSEDDTGLRADLAFREGGEGAGRARFRPATGGAERRRDEGVRGLHHVATGPAQRQVRAALPDPYRRRADSRLQPDGAGGPDRSESADEVHPLSRRLSVGWRDGGHRPAARFARMGRFGVAADHQLPHGQARLPRMAGRDAVQPDPVGSGLQPRRGDLRGDGGRSLPGRAHRPRYEVRLAQPLPHRRALLARGLQQGCLSDRATTSTPLSCGRPISGK